MRNTKICFDTIIITGVTSIFLLIAITTGVHLSYSLSIVILLSLYSEISILYKYLIVYKFKKYSIFITREDEDLLGGLSKVDSVVIEESINIRRYDTGIKLECKMVDDRFPSIFMECMTSYLNRMSEGVSTYTPPNSLSSYYIENMLYNGGFNRDMIITIISSFSELFNKPIYPYLERDLYNNTDHIKVDWDWLHSNNSPVLISKTLLDKEDIVTVVWGDPVNLVVSSHSNSLNSKMLREDIKESVKKGDPVISFINGETKEYIGSVTILYKDVEESSYRSIAYLQSYGLNVRVLPRFDREFPYLRRKLGPTIPLKKLEWTMNEMSKPSDRKSLLLGTGFTDPTKVDEMGSFIRALRLGESNIIKNKFYSDFPGSSEMVSKVAKDFMDEQLTKSDIIIHEFTYNGIYWLVGLIKKARSAKRYMYIGRTVLIQSIVYFISLFGVTLTRFDNLFSISKFVGLFVQGIINTTAIQLLIINMMFSNIGINEKKEENILKSYILSLIAFLIPIMTSSMVSVNSFIGIEYYFIYDSISILTLFLLL